LGILELWYVNEVHAVALEKKLPEIRQLTFVSKFEEQEALGVMGDTNERRMR
jgi:hypothetical protein